MSIPLNIDWQQILLHLLNFAILALGLYLLLYKPVKRFMDQRADHYQKMADEADGRLAHAASLESEYEGKLSGAGEEIAQMKAQAVKDAQASADAQLAAARDQAEKLLSDARLEAAAERDKLVADARRDIAELAAEAVDRLAKQSMDELYDGFFDAVKRGEAHEDPGA